MNDQIKAKGYKFFDTHSHSYFSYDVPNLEKYSPANLFFLALKRGMDYVTFTDHDTIEQNKFMLKFLKEKHPELLSKYVPGSEITVFDEKIGHTIHVNVYCLTEEDFNQLRKRSNDLKEFSNYCKEKNLAFQYNHPLWFEMDESVSITKERFDSILNAMSFFDVVEVCNSGRPLKTNESSQLLAKIFSLGRTAGSDSHQEAIGSKAITIAKGEDFGSFWENVKKGKSQIKEDHLDLKYITFIAMTMISDFTIRERVRGINRKAFRLDTGEKMVNLAMNIFYKTPLLSKIMAPLFSMSAKENSRSKMYLEEQNILGQKAIDYYKTKSNQKKIALKVVN